ncbi:hypothetical protein [uncultured Microbacterium sp.]|uniref:hypothetical protein n=1 Tax=uncultured Microbacterium sp. TaxID=191216 RepID=UPI0028D7EEEA|nr:hypothetical protein [uncultured Microbacterium sp.]
MEDLADESTWLEWRSLIPLPARVTELVTTDETRAEFLEGARLLRFDRRRRADGGFGPSPIQLVIADMLNAGRKFNAILEPRRTTKTTAVQAVIMGRCSLREDYLVGWTMAKADGGQKTGERFRKDIVSHVERLYPDKNTRPFIVNTGKGTEHIRWPNGSYFNAYAPGNDAFTSGAYDIAWVDESQDATPELTADMMTSIPPTLDGRYRPQMIGSGTAPEYQKGNLLWHLLSMEGAGVIYHGIPEDTDPEELAEWEPSEQHPRARVRELIELNHPGIGFTTPLDDVRDNFVAMKATPGAFNTEYLGMPGSEGSASALIKQPDWTGTRKDSTLADVDLPNVVALAIAIDPDGRWCSLAAAWKGKGRKRHVALLHHQATVDGFAKEIVRVGRKLKRPVLFDSGRPTENVEIAAVEKARPIVRTKAVARADIPRGAVLFMKVLKSRDLVHYAGQDPLDEAAEIAVRRAFGTTGSWAFGRPDEKNKPEDDVTPLEACARALYALEGEKERANLGESIGWG